MAEQNAWDSLVGRSNAQSKPWTEDPEYEKYRYQYGQSPRGASDAVSNYANRQAAVEERAAPQMQGAQMQGTQLDQGPANQTRDIQMGSLAGLQSAANGTAPSAAENLARQQMDRSVRAQTSAAGSVRGGPGATASAFRFASQGAAAQRADANQGIAAQRADEQAVARGQLANAGAAVRGQDLSAATANANLSQDTNKTNANLTQDASKTNAQLQIQGRALNDERASQYEQLANKVNEDQLDANLRQQQLASGVRQSGDALNQQTNIHNADRNWNVFQGAVGLGQGLVGGAAKVIGALSDPRSKDPVVGGSLASLGLGGDVGLGGRKSPHGVGGGTELDQSGGMSHDDLLAAGSGLASPQPVQGMVGGGGITGGYVPTGEDGSGAGMMMSDEDTKEAPQTYGVDEDRSSPTFRSWLSRASKGAPEKDVAPNGGSMTGGAGAVKSRKDLVDDLVGDAKGAKPYERDPDVAKGVAGAPRGYANGRPEPEPDDVSWSKPETWGTYKSAKKSTENMVSDLAPGTDDYEKTGGDAAKKSDPDWNNGGAPMKKEGAPGVFEALFGGLANARPYGVQPSQRDTTTSDPAAKRAAFEAGVAEGRASASGGKIDRPKGVGKPIGEGEELVVTADGEPEVRQHSTPSSRYISKDEIPPDTIAIDMTKPDPFVRSAASQSKGQGRAIAEGGTSAFVPSTPPVAPAPSAADRARAFARDIVRSDERTKDGFTRPSDGQMAQAMRSMSPAIYAYKSEYAPPDQKPGEVNIGPMANKMAADPVARTAIVRDPGTGMFAIDKTKAEKVIMGSLAALQHQVDELQSDVPSRSRAKKARPDGRAYA